MEGTSVSSKMPKSPDVQTLHAIDRKNSGMKNSSNMAGSLEVKKTSCTQYCADVSANESDKVRILHRQVILCNLMLLQFEENTHLLLRTLTKDPI